MKYVIARKDALVTHDTLAAAMQECREQSVAWATKAKAPAPFVVYEIREVDPKTGRAK